jgi:hypothetical protein
MISFYDNAMLRDLGGTKQCNDMLVEDEHDVVFALEFVS